MWTGCCYSLLCLTLALQKRSRDKRVQTFFLTERWTDVFVWGLLSSDTKKGVSNYFHFNHRNGGFHQIAIFNSQ